jgi:hypothetical protein
MRFPHRRILALSLLAGLASSGCSAVLYPFARAFGGRSEPELAASRLAFAEMKTVIATGPVFVFPARVFRDWKPGFEAEPAQKLVELFRSEINPQTSFAQETPEVPDTPHGANQLRYSNARGDVYAAWVRARGVAEGHLVFVEVIADAEAKEIFGGYCWVIDSSGRIAYGRLFNSHHFDSPSMPGMESFLRFVVKVFGSDLTLEPERLFPRYGVG